jgi:uncharacterized protein YdeI (YjbR/CyaY-like superfamily)
MFIIRYSSARKTLKKVYAKNRDEWRQWLEENHKTEKEVWLVYYKKGTGKASIVYLESVEEAICFGWIDGIIKKIDEETYTHKFTPRKESSKWSPLNIRLAQKMIKEGRMAETGFAAFNQREIYDEKIQKMRAANEIPLPPEIEQALKENKTAWENFNNLAPSYRKQYAEWLIAAKGAETRERRLAEAISLLEQNQKLGMR